MTAQELAIVRSVLVANKVVDATASDGDVSSAHQAMLKGPNATEYRAQLEAGGVKLGPNWLTILGFVGGAVALYFIWQHYKKPKQISAHDYPEPQPVDRVRRMGKTLGSWRHSMTRSMGGCGPKRRRMGDLPRSDTKYEFEPEIRFEGYRRRKARR